jgi:hypothetical protein
VSIDSRRYAEQVAALVVEVADSARGASPAPADAHRSAGSRITVNLITAERLGISVPGAVLESAHTVFRRD